MKPLLVRRAAVLQAKLRLLEDGKDCFTEHTEILAVHRIRKEFDNFVLAHSDRLSANPLEAVRRDFNEHMALLTELECLGLEASRVHYLVVRASGAPELIQATIDWLSEQKEKLNAKLSEIHSRFAEYWDLNACELQADAQLLAEFLAEGNFTKAETRDWVAMGWSKGPRYQRLLDTIASIDQVISARCIYFIHAGERLGPYFVDDLEKLLADEVISESDLAYHSAVPEWMPVSQIIPILEQRAVRPHLRKRRFGRGVKKLYEFAVSVLRKG